MSEIRRELTTHHDGCGLTELCKVGSCDEPHAVNGAHHVYQFERVLADGEKDQWHDECEGEAPALYSGFLSFQNGPRTVHGSTPGILDGAVLAVLIDRQECFQSGPFACAENAEVLDHLRAALGMMIARAQARAARGVLGKNEK